MVDARRYTPVIMGLTSKLFKGDPRLEACLVSDPAHITLGTAGPFVAKFHVALTVMGLGVISADEIQSQRYGPSTAAAILGYKTQRRIINPKYQNKPDNIVGKMTIERLDGEMAEFERLNPDPPPSPIPPVPPAPQEPLSRKFAIRCAGKFANFDMLEPADDDPTTRNVVSAPNFFQVFDIENMPIIQFDEKHAASYFMDAPGLLNIHIGAHLFKRFPRIFNLRIPTRLSELAGSCTYRTITRPGGVFESFFDLRLPQGLVTVPMFLHMSVGLGPTTPSATVLTNGTFRFEKLGL